MIFDHQLNIVMLFPGSPWVARISDLTFWSKVWVNLDFQGIDIVFQFFGDQNFQTHRNHGTKGIFTYSFSVKIDHSCG